jgi:dihydropteroate synthase
MEAALQAGARLVNDVTALSGDARALDVVAAREDTGVVLMHMRGGDPRTMQANPNYADVALDIYDYLEDRIAVCEAAGIGRERIAVDPGIGFGKTLAHNLRLLEQLAVYHALGSAVLLGASRKSFIGALSRNEKPAARQPGSLAAVLAGAARGCQIFRVHDVPETRQALKVWQAITEAES